MSVAENRFDLAAIGERAALEAILPEHFPAAFDLASLQANGLCCAEIMKRVREPKINRQREQQ